MINYSFTPFNVLAVIITISSLFNNIEILVTDFGLKTLFLTLIPIVFSSILWIIDYYLQKLKINYIRLFISELVICLTLVYLFLDGLSNTF